MLSPVLSHSSHVISVNISLQSQYIPPPSILWYIFKVQQYRITPKDVTFLVEEELSLCVGGTAVALRSGPSTTPMIEISD